jgi:Transposase DDE domain
MWCGDFKGWFRCGNGACAERSMHLPGSPLSLISDGFSERGEMSWARRFGAACASGGRAAGRWNGSTGSWNPSREDRRSHPDLPKDAVVEGRLIVRQVQPSNGDRPFPWTLFVSLEATAEEAIELYGKRWTIEVDLRSLKGTLRLEELACSREAMAKEIDVAMLAYNLVRAVMCTVAQRSGLGAKERAAVISAADCRCAGSAHGAKDLRQDDVLPGSMQAA